MKYSSHCKKYPPLGIEAERELLGIVKVWKEDKTGDSAIAQAGQKAKQQLIFHNLGLCLKWANYYQKNRAIGSLTFDDLVQAGVLGLNRGIEKFDFERQCRLSTCVSIWIKKYLIREIENHCRDVRIPVHAQGTLRKIRNAIAQGKSKETVLVEMGVSQEKYEFLLQSHQPVKSLDVLLPDGETCLGELLCFKVSLSDWQEEQEERANALYAEERLEHLLAFLSERERFVILSRFKEKPLTLKEVGDSLGLTKERVRQVQNKALKVLQNAA